MSNPEDFQEVEQPYDPNEIIEIVDDSAQEPMQEEAMLPQLPIEETNLAADLDEEELDDIAEKGIEAWKTDLDSRKEWEAMSAKYLEIFYQTDKAENPPWEGASEESIPVLTEAINQFQSRTYKAFFPNRYFVDALPSGQSNVDARERAERIAAHMNWQLGVKDKTYKRNKNQMFMATAIHGSDFTKTYFDHIKRRTVIQRVRAEDLVVPYHNGPKAIEELSRKTHQYFVSVNDTKILEKLGFYVAAAKPYTGHEKTSAVQDAVDEQQGIDKAQIDKDNEKDALLLEQHCLLDLDGDGISEPYIVWIDVESRKTLRIQIRYEIDETGVPTKDKEPLEHFTHYQFLPNPDGFYGFGLGFLLAKINLALNKLTRMFIDAGEQATVGNLTFLVSEALGLPGGTLELEMGKGIKIPRSVDDIRKHFMKLDFAGPNPAIQVAIDYLQNVAQRISSSSDIMAGQPDKVYQPQALLAMLEQGLQLYSSVQEFMAVSMEDELQKVYRLNAKYMQNEESFYDGDKQIQVTREDYQDDFRIMPIFDPKYATRSQKLAKAEAQLKFTMEFPLTAQAPQSLYLAGKSYLEALDCENIDELLPPPQIPQPVRIDSQHLENAYFLSPPDKRPLFDTFPDQNHLQHIEDIDTFISSFLDKGEAMELPLEGEDPQDKKTAGDSKAGKVGTQGDPGIKRLVQSMSTEQKQELIANLLRHRSQHLSFHFGQINGVMDENGNPLVPVTNPAQEQPQSPDLAALMDLMQ